MNLLGIKAIVFDLDGTLYEDTHHFIRYAEIMRSRLSPKSQENFMEECNRAILGNHLLNIGRLYDSTKDLILVHNNKIVTDAYSWDGSPLEKTLTEKLYPREIEIDMNQIISVGDLWWIPGSIGMHYGLDRATIHSCFLELREYMMSPEFIMKPVKGLKEALELLNSKMKLILLTNSVEYSSEPILEKLGIRDVFHKKIYQGKKPTRTVERFQEISSEFNLSFNEILSVGDNLINDIQPVKSLGCRTIYIDPFKIGGKSDADFLTHSIPQMVELIKTI